MVWCSGNRIIAVCLPLFFWILNSRVTAHDQFLVSGQEISIHGDIIPLTLYNSSSPIELYPSGVNGNMSITPPIQGFRLISECDIPWDHYEDGPDPMILNRNHLQGQKRKINLQADAPIPHDHISDTMLKIILITFFILIVGFIGRVFLRQMFQHPVVIRDCYHRWQNIWNWIRNRNGDDTAEPELESQNQPTQDLEPQNQPTEDLEPQNQPTQEQE